MSTDAQHHVPSQANSIYFIHIIYLPNISDQPSEFIFFLEYGEAGPSKILATIYQIKWRHITKDSNFHFNIIIPSIFTFPSGLLLHTFQPKISSHLFSPTHATSHLSHPSRFSHPKNNSMWSRSDAAVNIYQ
jgi:hypothetical protein